MFEKKQKVKSDLSKTNIRYNGKNHPMDQVIALKDNKSTVPAALISPLNKPFERLPYPVQNDDVRLMKVRDKFYVISGFKSYVNQMKNGDVIEAFVYTPKEFSAIATPVVLKASETNAIAEQLGKKFNVKIKQVAQQ